MVSFIKIGRMTDYMKIVSNKKMMTNVMNIKSGHVFCFRETYYMKLSDIGENCAVNLLDGLFTVTHSLSRMSMKFMQNYM